MFLNPKTFIGTVLLVISMLLDAVSAEAMSAAVSVEERAAASRKKAEGLKQIRQTFGGLK